MSSVSICVLARDEQDFLPACLASIEGADEVLVVDTGSTDDTVRLAYEGGARVRRMAWPGDFGVARSRAAHLTDGDWVLFLDADERLAPGAMQAIREAVDEGVVVGLVCVTDADAVRVEPAAVVRGDNALGEAVLQPRLLRRDQAMKWIYGVCEQPDVDLSRGVQIDAQIVHYGACHSERNARRNAPELWLRRAAQWPMDACVQAEAARRLRAAGELDDARSRALCAWSLAIAPGAGRRGLVQAAVVHTLLLLDDGKARDARHVLQRARQLGAGHVNLDLLLGLCAIELDDERSLAQGEAALRRAMDEHGRRFLVRPLDGATNGSSRIALATLLLAADRVGDAIDVLACAPDRRRKSLPARLVHAELCLAAGDAQRALRELLPMLEYAGSDGWILAARASELLGAGDDALAFCDRAISSAYRGFVAPHRRRLMAGLRARLAAGAMLERVHGGVLPVPSAVHPVVEGEAAARSGDLDRAHALFVEAIRRDVANVAAWRDLGVILHRAGHASSASVALRMATELAPEDMDARLDLAACLLADHRWPDAVVQLREVADMQPRAVRLLDLLDVQGPRRPVAAIVGTARAVELADALRSHGVRPVQAYPDVVALMGPTQVPVEREAIEAWIARCCPSMVVVGSDSEASAQWCQVARSASCAVVWVGPDAPSEPVDFAVNNDAISEIVDLLPDLGPRTAEPQDPLISVVVATKDRPEQMLALLDRLALQDLGPGVFEVVVVDDGSHQPLDLGLQHDRPFALRVVRQAPQGPAAARNAGVALCAARWVLFLDDDAVPGTDLVRRHLVLQGHAAEPKSIMGGFELLRRHHSTLWDHAMATTTLHLGRQHLRAGQVVGWRSFSIANASMPLWALRAVNGFDADGFPHPVYEDAELALRLERDLALPTLFHPEIRCGHDHRVDVDDWMRRAELAGEAQFRLQERHAGHAGVLDLGANRVHPQPALDALRTMVETGDAHAQQSTNALRKVANLPLTLDPKNLQGSTQTVMRLAAAVGDARHQRGLVTASARQRAERVDGVRSVSVVLVHRPGQPSACEHLQQAVQTLRLHSVGPVELVVVQCGESDPWLVAQADVHTIIVPECTPNATAWNAGVQVAAGATLFMCEHDILFTPGWRRILLRHMNAWPDVGLVAPLGAKSRVGLATAARSFAEDHAGQHAWPVVVPRVRMLVRREVFSAVGGLDPEMSHLAGEDFCMRAQAAGWRLRQAGDCLVGSLPVTRAVHMEGDRAFRERWALGEDGAQRSVLQERVWASNELPIVHPLILRQALPMLLGEVQPNIDAAQAEQRMVHDVSFA